MEFGMQSPYDPQEYKPSTGVAETAEVDVVRADVAIGGQDYIALRSAFGSIYVPKALGVTVTGLEKAVCANKLPPPAQSSADKPLQGDEAALAPAVIKTIESHCK